MLLFLALTLAFGLLLWAAASDVRCGGTVREAAVAGVFYPGRPGALEAQLDAMFDGLEARDVGTVRGLICPHADYEYSGRMAATACALLTGRDVETVMVLCPSHYVAFDGAYVSPADAYRTPLGLVPVSRKADLLTGGPFVFDPVCRVQRPGWWMQSPLDPPGQGMDTPETWEHSGEVQLPVLQRVLGDFSIVPVVMGQVDPARVAERIAPHIDARTILLASSDLSHFHSDQEARSLDRRCIRAMCDMDIRTFCRQEACGAGPVTALMYVARAKGWKPVLLGYCHSGDVTGDRDSVVGYAAVAFVEGDRVVGDTWSPEHRRLLLSLARQSLTAAARGERLAQVDAASLPDALRQPRGCFVTLTQAGHLRGCIGNIEPVGGRGLAEAVVANACSAAVEDPRFRAVLPAEVSDLHIEISVLTEPQPLEFSDWRDLLDRLRPNVDGVLLRIGSRGATYLPQVWEQLPDKERFLTELSKKAGCPGDAWKTRPVSVMTYQVEAFEESGSRDGGG